MTSRQRKLLAVLVLCGVALWVTLQGVASRSDLALTPERNSSEAAEASHPPVTTLQNSMEASGNSSAELSHPPLPSLGPHLRKIGECLGIRNALNDIAEMSYSALHTSIQNELGGLVEKNMDWKNVHLTLPNGEKRRIRLEVEAITEEAAGLRLKYYGVDKEDLPVPLPLPEDQSLNPSEAFVASLEGEGPITFREEAFRSTYGIGTELYHVERNGVLSEVEILHQGKNVKCVDLDGPQGTCRCF